MILSDTDILNADFGLRIAELKKCKDVSSAEFGFCPSSAGNRKETERGPLVN